MGHKISVNYVHTDLWGFGDAGKVLVISCGSSFVKFAVIIADNGNIFAEGIAECLFLENPLLKSPKQKGVTALTAE